MFCTKCGKEIMDETVICPNCGCETGNGIIKKSEESDLTNCISCNKKINKEFIICPYCSTNQESGKTEKATAVCIKCGAKIGEEYVVCPYCLTDQETVIEKEAKAPKKEKAFNESQKTLEEESKTKFCRACGAKMLQSDEICLSCGVSQTKKPPTKSAETSKITPQKIIGIGLFAISLISFIFAFQCFGMDDGLTTYYQSYGGDAYTGIQNAAADTARNISLLTRNVNTISAYLFILLGLFSALMGLKKFLFDSKKTDS